jgi:quercetin dioxygenase-like cupin family protein
MSAHRGQDDEDLLDPVAFEALGLAAATPAPESLRERVLSAVAAMPERAASEIRPGVTLVRTSVVDWKVAFPGVYCKELHRDTARRSRSILFRMEPKSRYPDHLHSFLEELFVLEGSAILTGRLLKAGDYCRSEPGTSDHDISTEEGVVFLAFLTEEADTRRGA